MSKAKIVIDLGFGDAGKGTVVDFLAAQHVSDLVIRFNGGAQAAHNVVVGGIHHTFRQFGSGTLAGARTLYTAYCLFDPLMFLEEVKELSQKGVKTPEKLFFLEKDCAITSIFQQAMNRIRETLRAGSRHGSCGLGIGETQNDKEENPDFVLRVFDLESEKNTFEKLETIRKAKLKIAESLLGTGEIPDSLAQDFVILNSSDYSHAAANAYCKVSKMFSVLSHEEALHMLKSSNSPIFEGAQGVLLDQDYGFYPYVTRSKTTPINAAEMCKEASIAWEVTGVIRSYSVRHGAGPMPTHDKELSQKVNEYHNQSGQWQGDFRVGHFDAPMIALAYDICLRDVGRIAVDDIFVTCLDRLAELENVKVCTAYKDTKSLTPQSLKVVGKKDKRAYVGMCVSWLEPVYSDFYPQQIKGTVEYGKEYAQFILSKINRDLKISGLSFGAARDCKIFL
jgi:adenylosuccinate synthase